MEEEFNLSENINRWKDTLLVGYGESAGPPIGAVLHVENDVKEFIKRLNRKATKQIMLDFDNNPITEEEHITGEKEFAYCGGCDRFVIEEGCICGLVDIEEINRLAGDKFK